MHDHTPNEIEQTSPGEETKPSQRRPLGVSEMQDIQRRRAAYMRTQRRKRRQRQVVMLAAGVLLLVGAVFVGILIGRHASDNPTKDDWESADHRDQSPRMFGTGDPDWIEQMFLPLNEYSRPGTPLPKINGIVVHYVGNPNTTAKQNRSYFAGLAESGATYASSHYIVGLDGEIVQCVPLTEIAYCSNKRNDDTISIEVCHPDESGQFNPETYRALVRLCAFLCERYDLTADDIIRHYDVTGKICPKYFVEHEDAWMAFLTDVNQYKEG